MVDIPKDGNGEGIAEDDPSKKQPSAGVSSAALNPAIARMWIPAPETIIHWIALKTTHSSKIQHRRRGTPALMRERPKKR